MTNNDDKQLISVQVCLYLKKNKAHSLLSNEGYFL